MKGAPVCGRPRVCRPSCGGDEVDVCGGGMMKGAPVCGGVRGFVGLAVGVMKWTSVGVG